MNHHMYCLSIVECYLNTNLRIQKLMIKFNHSRNSLTQLNYFLPLFALIFGFNIKMIAIYHEHFHSNLYINS